MSDLTAMALNAAHQLPAAELHGAVCGLAVCHGDELPLEDLLELVGVEALGDQASVQRFVDASIEDLQAEDMTFTPLLPADDTAIEERIEALGQWCASFLAGLAAGLARRGAASLDECPDEVREIVRDFAAIAQVDPAPAAEPAARGEGAAKEEAETDFVELEEFVKVGTLLIMTTLAGDGPGADGRDDDTDHPAE